MSNGKGSKPRPLSVSREEYGDRHDRIFGSRHSVSEELPWLVPPPATPKDRTLQQEWDRLMRRPPASYLLPTCAHCGHHTCSDPECGG